MSEPKTLGEQSYEQFARRYANHVATKPHNAYYERPATLSLLPNVAGKRVLDAGCGPGEYAQWLVDHGVQVVAVDVTPEFVEIARERLKDRATVLQANLAEPLTFAADSSFDLIICPLVLDYIEDWTRVFAEFFRILRPGGILVYSAGHPMADWQLVQSQSYFQIEQFTMTWRGFGEPYPVVTSYRRPLSAFINPLLQAGFALDTLLEPQPTDDFRAADPKDYAELMREPAFLCVRASKPAMP